MGVGERATAAVAEEAVATVAAEAAVATATAAKVAVAAAVSQRFHIAAMNRRCPRAEGGGHGRAAGQIWLITTPLKCTIGWGVTFCTLCISRIPDGGGRALIARYS